MDPHPDSFPVLSYVMSKLPSFGPRRYTASDSSVVDIEQPLPISPSSSTLKEPHFELKEQMPHLTDPKLIAQMRSAVADVAQTRSVLKLLGERPDHESVDTAKAKLADIEAKLYDELDEIALSPPDSDAENSRKKVLEREKQMYKAVLSLDEMHEAYGKLLMEAEERLMKIYESAVAGRDGVSSAEEVPAVIKEEVDVEVVRILNDQASGKSFERIDLSGRQLRFLPEVFGKIRTLVVLNLSSNQLQVIPDSIAGLENLEELNLSSNLLETLPESIGLLLKMKVLDVSTNKLTALPDSICHCRSLVELDASFNKLTYLPTNIGFELVNLRRLSIQLNKIRSLPTSIGEMSSLRHLDAHFNELRGLPLSIGRLTNIEYLNLSSNFSDLTEIPYTFGYLINLKELDLSNNQIHELPITFGHLDSLIKLNLEENPITVPPKEIVNKGLQAIKAYLKGIPEGNEPTGWLTHSTSWLKDSVSVVSESVSEYLGVKGNSNGDPYLNQQF